VGVPGCLCAVKIFKETEKMQTKFLSLALALALILSLVPVATVNVLAIRSGLWEYVVDGETARITSYYGEAENVSIPSVLDDFLVTSIGDEVFQEKAIVTVILIPLEKRHIELRQKNRTPAEWNAVYL
jgi:hypothetical protein